MAFKHYMLLLALSATGLSGMEITQQAFKPHNLSDVRLTFDKGNYYAISQSKKHRIQPAFIDKKIRNISEPKLKQLLANDFYLKLKKLNSNQSLPEYALSLNGRLKGGGPWLAIATFAAGCVTTTAAAVGTFVATTPSGPIAQGLATWGVISGGMSLTGKATAAAAVLPTP